MNQEIHAVEQQLYELTQKLNALRKDSPGEKVPNYSFDTLEGQVSLLELFGKNDKLLVIHNMGQGCRYCMLWADGFNGFLPHLESVLSVVLVSRDAPEVQRRYANSRGWRFRLASHGGGSYITEQSVSSGGTNTPGVVVYERIGEEIFRKNSSVFGPGDQFCSMWNLLGLAGMGEDDWTPQYTYWTRPQKMDDGGLNIIE